MEIEQSEDGRTTKIKEVYVERGNSNSNSSSANSIKRVSSKSTKPYAYVDPDERPILPKQTHPTPLETATSVTEAEKGSSGNGNDGKEKKKIIYRQSGC